MLSEALSDKFRNIYLDDFNNGWILRHSTIYDSTMNSYFGHAIATDEDFNQLAASNYWYGIFSFKKI